MVRGGGGVELRTVNRDSGFGIRDSGFGIRDSGFGIRDSGFGIRDSGFGIRDSGFAKILNESRFKSHNSRISNLESRFTTEAFHNNERQRFRTSPVQPN